MIIFSVDPGLRGAWAVIVDGVASIVGDMPISGEATRCRVAAGVLAGFMRDAHPDLLIIEAAQAMPGNGSAGMFRYGMAYGAVLAVANVLNIPGELVTPQTWKRHYKLLGQPKEASRQKALDLAPKLASSLSKKRDDGRAEALLIGLYAAATFDHRPEVRAA